jgi:hypothetical protein
LAGVVRGLIGATIGFMGTAVTLFGEVWFYFWISGKPDMAEGPGTLATYLCILLCPLEAVIGCVAAGWRGRLFAKILLAIGVVALLAGLGLLIWFESKY